MVSVQSNKQSATERFRSAIKMDQITNLTIKLIQDISDYNIILNWQRNFFIDYF